MNFWTFLDRNTRGGWGCTVTPATPRATVLPPEPDTRPTEPCPPPVIVGRETLRGDVAPLVLLEPVVSAVAGEP